MQTTLRIVLVIVMFIYLFLIARAVKRKNMRINYLILWIIIGIFLIVALIFPNFIDKISGVIGFEVPINMIFSIAIFVVLYFIHDLMKLFSKEEKKNVLLTQEISLLKSRVEKLEKNREKKGQKLNNE